VARGGTLSGTAEVTTRESESKQRILYAKQYQQYILYDLLGENSLCFHPFFRASLTLCTITLGSHGLTS